MTQQEREMYYAHPITPESTAREAERLYSLARHNEAAALRHARDEGMAKGMEKCMAKERKKWQGVVADKDKKWQNVVADKDAEIARLREQLTKKNEKREKKQDRVSNCSCHNDD
jgi:hypothetical protein